MKLFVHTPDDNPNAVELDINICKNLGIGNSTGLGMAPFIVNHPTLLNNWILAREKALKSIREIKNVDKEDEAIFLNCLKKSLKNTSSWNTSSQYQKNKINELVNDLNKFLFFIKNFNFQKEYAFNDLYIWIEKNLKLECSEYLVSIMMEPYDKITDPLIHEMSSEEENYFNIPSERKISDLRNILEDNYSEILKIDFNEKKKQSKFLVYF